MGRLLVGTSGWTYDDWAGRFYPEGVVGTNRLEYYARHFAAVELNATFYRLPTLQAIASWNRRLPPDFHMVVKGPRGITHLRKLIGCEEELARFLERVKPLVPMRAILWQLPPSLHKDLRRLERFLASLPRWIRHAVEFRHRSWYSEGVAELLSAYDVAWVAVSHPSLPDDIVPTADFLYVRFHGLGTQLYRWHYDLEELRRWARRLALFLPTRGGYAFFNNDYAAHAVSNAMELKDLLDAGCEPSSPSEATPPVPR